ncbi:MAG: sugar ABC transporter permease [Oscillospiraceae bacterium]|nr:sugar ABC transporter permease [Oscillospiraceae bacterium]
MILIPFFSYIALWNLIPLVYGLYLGFTEFNALGSSPTWVGLKNFETFFTVPEYRQLLFRQVWMGMLALACNTVISFILALALNVQSRVKGVFRTAIYVPNVAAVSATTAVFVALLNPLANQGLNKVLVSMGFPAITWNYSQGWMVFWIIAYFVWQRVGPAVIIWLGGLQGIDPSLYEAAKVDGATFWQQVFYITLPGLKFISMYILLTGIIGAMQMFDVIMFISKGNPFGRTDVLMYRIYRDGFVNFNLGMAGAESLVLGLVTVVFALGYLWLQQRRDD